jgi:hypothetical protein
MRCEGTLLYFVNPVGVQNPDSSRGDPGPELDAWSVANGVE